MINQMTQARFDTIKRWFDKTLDNKLIRPKQLVEGDFIYVDESMYFEESSKWIIVTGFHTGDSNNDDGS